MDTRAEVGIRASSETSWDELHHRHDLAGLRHMSESDLLRNPRYECFMFGVSVGVHEADRESANPRIVDFLQLTVNLCLVRFPEDIDPFTRDSNHTRRLGSIITHVNTVWRVLGILILLILIWMFDITPVIGVPGPARLQGREFDLSHRIRVREHPLIDLHDLFVPERRDGGTEKQQRSNPSLGTRALLGRATHPWEHRRSS